MNKMSLKEIYKEKLYNPYYAWIDTDNYDTFLNSIEEKEVIENILRDCKEKGFKTIATIILDKIINNYENGDICYGTYCMYFKYLKNHMIDTNSFNFLNKYDPTSREGHNVLDHYINRCKYGIYRTLLTKARNYYYFDHEQESQESESTDILNNSIEENIKRDIARQIEILSYILVCMNRGSEL